jgi:hypothetical protein
MAGFDAQWIKWTTEGRPAMRHYATSEPRQFRLFEDAQSTALLYTQAVNRLLEHDLDDAAEDIENLRAARHAEAPWLATILGTLREMQTPHKTAVEAAALMAVLDPMVQRMVGDHAEPFNQRLWADLAFRFPLEPIMEDQPQAHPGWMHWRSGNPHKAWETLQSAALAQAPQWAIKTLALAGYAIGPQQGWAPLCWHAWRWPEDTTPLIRQIGNTELSEQHRTFERENEAELPHDWFPAWAITQNPDLAVLLRQSAHRQAAPSGDQAQQGAMAACDLVLAEIGGTRDMAKRQCLQKADDWVFRQYLKTR